MPDETEGLADLPELDTPAIETEPQESEEPVSLETLADDGTEPTADEADGDSTAESDGDEFVTLERNGKQYQVPKELEAEFLMQSDYTKKTQSLAEERRALEQQQEALNQQAQFTKEELRAAADLSRFEADLEQYANVDWQALEQQDPMAAQSHWRQYQQLKEQHGQAVAFLQNRGQQRAHEAQQTTAKRLQETREFATKNIKGWSPELDAKITQFAIEEGMSRQFLESNINPLLLKVLHKAWLGDQALKRSQAPKPSTPKPAITPLRTVAAKSSPRVSTDLASADMEAYVAARKRGVGG